MVVLCAGCECPILDKFLLNVLDRTWHTDCVQCHDCKITLTEKCFSRDGKLYCRQDFHRRFGTKCGGCQQDILPTELVRRARDRVYHLKCFTCLACGKQLATGEELYMLDESRFLCKDDYLAKFRPSFGDSDHHHHHHHHQLTPQLLQQQHNDHLLNVLNNNNNTNNNNNNNNHTTNNNDDTGFSDKEDDSPAEDIVDDDDDVDSDHNQNHHSHNSDTYHGRTSHGSGVQIKQEESPSLLLSNIHNSDSLDSLNSVNDCGQGTGAGSNSGMGVGDEGTMSGSRSGIGGNNGAGSGSSLGGGVLHQTINQKGNQSDGVGSKETSGVDNNSSGAGKRRGPRTTIKAKQLETLKAAFAATPKPTRHIREQLAQETGLNMRVIQVWFQNRRSKERRMKQLSAMGVRRPFYRNPRRLRGLRPGEDLVDEMGQPGFNYFVENGDFYPAYAGYHDYFNPAHHPHPDDIIGYLPTSGPQSHMLDPVSGGQLTLHESAFLGVPGGPGEMGGMLPPRNLTPPSPDPHAMMHHHHHHHQHDNGGNGSNPNFPAHLQPSHLHQAALVPSLQHSPFARFPAISLRTPQPPPSATPSSQQVPTGQQGQTELPTEIW